jgi:transportin-1
MSAFALLGDLAKSAPTIIEAALPELLEEAIASLDPVNPSVCNNAVWAIGEVCVRCGENPGPLEPFAPALMQHLIALLMGNDLDGSGRGIAITGIAENAAATTGRLAMVNANFVSADLSRFLMGWCEAMAKVVDPKERRDAFTGFIRAVYANPNAIQTATSNVADAISAILFAVVSWHMSSHEGDFINVQFEPFPHSEAELGNALSKLLKDIKSSVGDETWENVQKQLPVNVRRLLREAYQL